MTDLILTEKFSVAADFAKALGIKTRRDGYFEGVTHVITWAVGHLVELFEPDDYDPGLKQWKAATLPLIPETFQYKPIKKSFKQFKIIKTLLNKGRFNRVVIATDAGREGEVIARTILLESGFRDKNRIVRFWTSQALVPGVVRTTMGQLRPITDYDRLWRAGYYRQVADWLVGMNLTRILTVRLKDLFSVGRVQTAVLALVVDRRKEREVFIPETYWLLRVIFVNDKGQWTGLWFKAKGAESDDEKENKFETRISGKKMAHGFVQRLGNEDSSGVVVSVKREKKNEQPPLLFSLTDLQQEANNRFGFPARKTLALAQTLYQDRKCLSYPRSDSRVMGTTSLDLVNQIIKNFGTAHPDIFSTIDPGRVTLANTRVFNDARLTDHHALIPFKPIPAGASRDEHRLFDLVVRRFAAAFHPDCWFERTRVVTKFAEETFQTVGRVILDPGWRRVFTTGSRDQSVGEIIPPLEVNDRGRAEKVDLEEKRTSPLPDYSDALLLKDMTNPGRYVDADAIKRFFRGDTGIGTQSTRAQIIETLVSREYVTRVGKRLIATDKGVYLIAELRRCPIASALTRPDETARWEMGLNEIALGRGGNLDFLDSIKTFVSGAVAELKLADLNTRAFAQEKGVSCAVGTCPSCGKPVWENKKTFSCEDKSCGFVIFKQIAGKPISLAMASNLLKYRKSGPFKGFISKKKKRFAAGLRIIKHDKEWRVEFDFSAGRMKDRQGQDGKISGPVHLESSPSGPSPLGHCPLCGGQIIQGKIGFGCSNWRIQDGDCRFVIWKKILGKNLTPKNIATLVAGKTTRHYVFKDDSGEKFSATLRMVKANNDFFIRVESREGERNARVTTLSCLR